jgi:exopolysaccharide biosynthesis polyprenyl glycosylphosphotransferase
MAVASGVAGAHRQGTTSSARGSLRRALVLIDALTACAVWSAVAMGGPGGESAMGRRALVVAAAVVVAAGGTVAALASKRLYLSRTCASSSIELAAVVHAVPWATLVGVVALRSVAGPLAWWRIAGGALVLAAALGAVRAAFDAWLRASRAAGRYVRPIVVVGDNAESGDVVRLVSDHPELGYRVERVLADGDDLVADLRLLLDGGRVTGAVVVPSALCVAHVRATVSEVLSRKLHVHMSTGLTRVGHRRLHVVPLAHEPLYYVERAELSPIHRVAKRTLDVAVAVPALVISAPLLAVAMACVKIHDRGPTVHRQLRVGMGGRTFTLYKLRTMVPDAEARLAEVAGGNARNGPLLKVDRDPRVTRVGRFLRKTSIDELPQLVNVVLGQMSLVGPRPALPSEVAQFDDELLDRHCVKPGITGLWQVEARDNPSFAAYRRLDLFYVENWSVGLDVVILVATVGSIVARALRGGEIVVAPEPAIDAVTV